MISDQSERFWYPHLVISLREPSVDKKKIKIFFVVIFTYFTSILVKFLLNGKNKSSKFRNFVTLCEFNLRKSIRLKYFIIFLSERPKLDIEGTNSEISDDVAV